MLENLYGILAWLAGVPAMIIDIVGSLSLIELILYIGIFCLVCAVLLWPEKKEPYFDFLNND